MDLDFDRNIRVQCVECCNTYTLEDCDEVDESSSSARCPFCGRFNFVDCLSLFGGYVYQMEEEDAGGKLYDFRTGKLEDSFPDYRFKRIKPKIEEKRRMEKEKRKMIDALKKEYKKTLGIK